RRSAAASSSPMPGCTAARTSRTSSTASTPRCTGAAPPTATPSPWPTPCCSTAAWAAPTRCGSSTTRTRTSAPTSAARTRTRRCSWACRSTRWPIWWWTCAPARPAAPSCSSGAESDSSAAGSSPAPPEACDKRSLAMSVVIFPEVLARVARLPAARLEGRGATVRELVEDVCGRHAGLREHLFHGNDQLKEHFLLTAAGELLEADSPLPEDAELDILLATSGGLDCDELSNDEVRRYVRHLTLPDVGRQGQLRLKKARVLIIGTGGLG